MRKIFALFLVLALLLALVGCKGETEEGGSTLDSSFSSTREEMFTKADMLTEPDISTAVTVTLNGSGADASGGGVKINGSSVTVTDGGVYILTGTLTGGTVVVDAGDNDKPRIILSGVNIASANTAAIYVKNADKVFLFLHEGTENTLSSAGAFTAVDGENVDAAIYSKSDLSVGGNGTLTVTSLFGHGIVSKDDLVIAGGSISVTAASHALSANDSIRICDTVLELTSGKDGIQAEHSEDTSLGFVYIAGGNISVCAEGDGISASSYVEIESGEITVTSGGGSKNSAKTHSDSYGRYPGASFGSSHSDTDSTSTKGIKAEHSILIEGGNFNINSADDAIHANNSVIISGGTFKISTGDDAVHADEKLEISGGTLDIQESYEGLEAMHVTVSGGSVSIVAEDDGINASGGNDGSGMGGRAPGGDMFGGGSSSSGSITISGGTVYINASGDGIDANGSLTITGGHTTVCGPTTGDTAVLDYDKEATISGGTFIGTGSYMMAQSFSSGSQGVIAVSVGTRVAGTKITLTDSLGNVIVSESPALPYAIVILSSPDVVKGEEYMITVGDTSGTFAAQ
ncbi:MAG: carbohydrate-binding domain-containing protein [Clostridia bacterium]|nr:carbohydrate-binding domain-containing protein [Clostridia bacterium]